MTSIRKKALTNISPNDTSALARYWSKKPGVLFSVDLYQFFRGYKFNYIEFGNYNSQEYRSKKLHDLLLSCQYVLSKFLKTKNLGLDYNLNVAFGSRGLPKTGGVFFPNTMFINLTHMTKVLDLTTGKYRKHIFGLESFMHEYAHAVEFFIGRFVCPIPFCNYLSESWDKPLIKDPLRLAMSDLLLNYYESQFALNPKFLKDAGSDYKKPISNKAYWVSPNECFARISEQCLRYYTDITKNDKNYICHSASFYSSAPSVYMPENVLKIVFPFWLDVMNLIGEVLRGKYSEKK